MSDKEDLLIEVKSWLEAIAVGATTLVLIGSAVFAMTEAEAQTLTIPNKDQTLICQPLTLWEDLQGKVSSELNLTPRPEATNKPNSDDSLSITASRTECYAPCGVHFSVNDENRLHKRYEWVFGDESKSFKNTDDDSNRALGIHVGHVFNNAGTYTTTVINGDRRNSVSIKVSDYNGQTFCVNCNTGSRVSSLAVALKAVAKSRSGRVLLPDGSSHNLNETIPINRATNVLIESDGTATVNILNGIEAALRFYHSDNVTISGISFKGDYNPTTGKGLTWSTDAISTFNTSNVTVYRNSFTGINKGVFTTAGINHVIIDNFATDWHDYGAYSQNFDVSGDGQLSDDEKAGNYILAGNDFQQNPNAVSGAGGKRGSVPRWADHSAFRQQWSHSVGIHQNTLTSTTGWSSNGKGHNPPLRFHQGGDSGFSGSITENRINGGFVVLSAAPMNRQTIAGKGELLIEKNTLKASSNTIYVLRLSYSESVIRDNNFINNTVSDSELLPFHYFVEVDYGKLTEENVSGNKFFSNNTFKLDLPSVPIPFKYFGNSYDKTNGRGVNSLIME